MSVSIRRRLVLIVVLVMIMIGAGCSSDDGAKKPPSVDADVAIVEDTSTASDAVEPDVNGAEEVSADADALGSDALSADAVGDAQSEDADGGDTSQSDTSGSDATQSADADGGDTSETDTSGPVDPYADRPLGQCTVNADCPNGPQGRICNRVLPGGSCGGCGNDSHCPVDTSCVEGVGSCAQDCTTTNDCAPGLSCGATGRCGAMLCVDGACPVPLFGCSASNRCQRVSCTVQADCPAMTTCISGLCIEDRQTN